MKIYKSSNRVYEYILFCILFVQTSFVFAQYSGGNADGNNMNEVKVLTSCSYLPVVNYSASYTGGNADGNNMNEVKVLTSCSYLPVVNYASSYTGGNADGNNMNEVKVLTSCSYLPVVNYASSYTGGNADGYYSVFMKCQSYIGCSIIATITQDTNVCKGSPITVAATGGKSYKWMAGNDSIGGTASISVTADSTMTYTVYVSDTICTISKTVTVTVNTLTATVTGITNVCPGNSTTLKASGGTNYLWTGGTTTDSITVSPTKDTVVSVTVKNGLCPDTTIKVSISLFNASPVINGDTVVCKGDSAKLTITTASSYLWSTGDNTQSISLLPVSDVIISVVLTSGACTGTDSVTVKVMDYPTANAGTDKTICKGDSIQIGSTAANGITYSWLPQQGLNNSAAAQPIANPFINTTYILSAANGKCTKQDSVLVTVNSLPDVIATAETSTLTKGESTTLKATGANKYIWNPGLYLSDSTLSNPVSKPEKSITYIISGTDNNGCSNKDTLEIKVIDKDTCGEAYIPNAFSPNENNFNDVFKIRIPTTCVKDVLFTIYDRWGNKVFETNDVIEATQKGWDGTFNGKALNTGVFVYYAKITLANGDEVVKKGNVSLIR